MTILDRYILRQSLSIMVFVTAALSAAVWLAQSLRLVDLIVNRGLSAEVFLYLALLILPRFLDIVLPIGAFIAVLFVFNRLTSESELVVMRGAGMGPFALARPVFVLAGIGCAALLSLSALFPAGIEPGVQGSAVRDSQPLRLGAAAGGHVHNDFEQADDLYRRARRARPGYRPADQRQSRSAATGHDHGRARRLRR